MKASKPYDAIVIGSGFAGAVTACRLAEAGLDVCILERGRRFVATDDFPVYPKTADPNVPSDAPKDGRDAVQPDGSSLLWGRGNGIWDFRDLGGVLVGQAAGYGGGSLIYANVHLRPPAHVFDERWPIKREDLEPYYDLAAQMLRVAPLPDEHAGLPKRVQLERAASDLERLQKKRRAIDPQAQETYLRTFSPPLAVNFREEETEGEGADKKGVERQGVCDLKGNCCLGCPQGAKNTLDLNYLRQAEDSKHTDVKTLAEVVWIEQVGDENRIFKVDYRNHLAGGALESRHARNVFLCAGAVNTTELLLRCREAKKLHLMGAGLGTRFHPNQDALAAVFDCDEPQELDRGPTITASLAYDREPSADESSARWRIGFAGAGFEPKVGSKIRSGSGGEAQVAAPAYVISGSYEEGDAVGELTLAELKGAFDENEALRIDEKLWGRVDTRPQKLRHWFLVQDGGLPVEVEPALGVFRSPLWLGRNGFREKKRPPDKEDWPENDRDGDDHDPVEHAAPSQRIGYATLPIEALTDLLSGLARGAAGFRLPEVSELGLQLLRDAEDEKKRWRLLPDQLDSAIGKLRRRTLDGVALAAEDIVSAFLEEAARSVSKKLDEGLAEIAYVGKKKVEEKKKIEDLQLASRTLRLGVQLLWGSQAGLARAIADQVVETKLLGRGQLVEAGVDLLRRVLDYRLGNGRTSMLLSMGLDSAPGRLELELPSPPRIGTELRGAKSGTRAFFVAARLDKGTSFRDGTAKGILIVTGETGGFAADELLFAGPMKIGMCQGHEPLNADGQSEKRGSSENSAGLPLSAVRIRPDTRSEGRSLASRAPLRAQLPESIDAPERGVQERVLRDIASAWDGELRTDPLWTFFNRRVTVHAQGGCPMGRDSERGVTTECGAVYGCPGLYVMDAAAFPGPVGANPSATIAAIAEYKVARFLESTFGTDATVVENLDKKRENATTWVEKRGRERLDPFGQAAPNLRSVEPAHRPIGIEFKERMVGRERGEGGRAVETQLKVRIDDLADFLARHARNSNVSVPIVDGQLTIGDKVFRLDPKASFMIVMARTGLDESGQEVRLIEYLLVPDTEWVTDDEKWKLITDDEKWKLDGRKTIRDDPGLDVWQDTTTLEFELTRGLEKRTGELELPASEFFGNQLPSFHVDTDDPVRQAWAMLSFGKFFFGNLAAVYLPGLDRLDELSASLLGRGHG